MAKSKKKKGWNRSAVGAGLATLMLVGGSYWVVRTQKSEVRIQAYQVKEVLDGDTFVTTEDQRIRLAGVEAPELVRCGSNEAKDELEKLIKGKALMIKVVYNDDYKRLVSYVYTLDGFVNAKMLESGWGYYSRPPADAPEELKHGSDVARMEKRGIYSTLCTQEVSPDPKCVVKGNVSTNNYGMQYYRYPGCRLYGQTIVELYKGDDWFCSVKDAVKAGFVEGEDCPK